MSKEQSRHKTFEKLEEFIQLAKREGVCELKYEKSGEKYEVCLVDSKGGGNKQMGERDDYPPSPSPSPHKGTIKGKETVIGKEKDLVEITSPFVGTFYQAPSQESGPYVKIGSQVSTGQVLCIIEAMKIMNEIESDVAGDIVEICCENENYVEFGQVLFKIKTTN